MQDRVQRLPQQPAPAERVPRRDSPVRSPVRRYGLALVTVLLAASVTYLFRWQLNELFTPFFFAAILASAWYGGSGPGLLATCASAIALQLLAGITGEGRHAFSSDMVRLSLFTAVSLATSSAVAVWHRDRLSMQRANDELEARVHRRAEELLRLNQQLRAEIAERERAEAEAKRTGEQFRELFEFAPVPYHEIDHQGIIRRVNARELELLGYTEAEMVGRPVWEFVQPEQRAASEASVKAKLSAGRIGPPFTRPYRTKNGDTVLCEIHERLILGHDGSVAGIRTTLLDITARLEAEQEIRRLNSELEHRVQERTAELRRSNEDLQQFAYAASHDLQEPLRVIAGYASLLARRYQGKLDRDADDFIAFLVDGAGRMTRMINDLLALSRVGSRDVRPFGAVPMGDVVASAVKNLQVAIEESSAVIRWDALPAVWGDESRLTQLLQNLLSNAIKYRGAHPPEIRVSVEDNGDSWVCSVRDNGIGFDMEHAERVFGIFRRLHGAEYPGTGMGLAIARRIVEYHGGRIWATSARGRGATFHFTIPKTSQATRAGKASA